MKSPIIIPQLATALVACLSVAAQSVTVLPPSYAMPSGTVNTNQPGFHVRPYQTTTSSGGNLTWTEAQLNGVYGPNLADLSGADANGYYTVSTVVNWNISGGAVDTFAPGDPFPGIGAGSTINFSEEVLTYIAFPTNGTYTMGVNSDDGFGVTASVLNPKDPATGISLGKLDGTRGSADTLFQFSISQPGIYPFRLLYLQAGGGANVSWFSVFSDSLSTNFVLLNDQSTPGALNTYASASIAPPYATAFAYNPAGFAFVIKDDVTALDPSSLKVSLNGTAVTVTTSKSGSATTVTYSAPVLLAQHSTNQVAAQFADNASTPHSLSAAFSFIVPSYTAMPPEIALPASAVDKTKSGFLFRIHQIDNSTYNVLPANVAHAEAQLAGLLIDPVAGTPYPSIADPGTQPDGSLIVPGVINFSFNTSAEEGAFNTANGHPDSAIPGISNAINSDNLAGEIVGYLDLKAGFYTFAVNSADGFRLSAAANPYDPFGTTLGLFDYRGNTKEITFGVSVQTAGIYPIRLTWYRMAKGSNGAGDAGLELYTIATDGTKVLVNDTANANSVKAYWQRTAGYGAFVKYAGPSAFVSPFGDSSDVGFSTASVILSDGSTNKVNPSSVVWSVDGVVVATNGAYANGLTTLSYTPAGLQLPRTTHAAKLVYAEAGSGALHTNTWSFHLLRNYVLPAPLYFEDFESTPAGPSPSVPTGWTQVNFTGSEVAGNDPANLNSDFYLGWVVVDKSFNISKDFGVSAYVAQVLNGSTFDESTNPLLANHYLRAESDARQNGPPGQIQYIYTKPYDLSGKPGIVIAFDSAYEQNQDSLAALEYSIDNNNWLPILYWVQGDYDSQAGPDVIRDGTGVIDVNATLLTSYSDVARYTDATSGQLVGGNYGFFIKAPITPALAPYIEGRYNDDGTESKRIELYRVPAADNQKSVTFRFVQAGTSSWYWAIDNWGVYSVPSLASSQLGAVSIASANGKVVISWQGSGTLSGAASLSGPWVDVPNGTSSPVQVTPTAARQFYRLHQ